MDDDMLSLNLGNPITFAQANAQFQNAKLDVNSQVSSVVQLEDDSNAESISFHN